MRAAIVSSGNSLRVIRQGGFLDFERIRSQPCDVVVLFACIAAADGSEGRSQRIARARVDVLLGRGEVQRFAIFARNARRAVRPLRRSVIGVATLRIRPRVDDILCGDVHALAAFYRLVVGKFHFVVDNLAVCNVGDADLFACPRAPVRAVADRAFRHFDIFIVLEAAERNRKFVRAAIVSNGNSLRVVRQGRFLDIIDRGSARQGIVGVRSGRGEGITPRLVVLKLIVHAVYGERDRAILANAVDICGDQRLFVGAVIGEIILYPLYRRFARPNGKRAQLHIVRGGVLRSAHGAYIDGIGACIDGCGGSIVTRARLVIYGEFARLRCVYALRERNACALPLPAVLYFCGRVRKYRAVHLLQPLGIEGEVPRRIRGNFLHFLAAKLRVIIPPHEHVALLRHIGGKGHAHPGLVRSHVPRIDRTIVHNEVNGVRDGGRGELRRKGHIVDNDARRRGIPPLEGIARCSLRIFRGR